MHGPSDWDVNWMSPLQGRSPLVQVKDPYGNFDMVNLLVGFHPATWSVQSTLADNTRKRGSGSIKRKKKKIKISKRKFKLSSRTYLVLL